MYIWHHTHKHLPSKNAKKPWIFWGSAHRYAHTQNRYIHTYYIFVLWWSYIRWIEYVFIPRIISRWFCKNHIISAPGWLSPSLSICIGRKLKIRHSIMAEVLLHVLHRDQWWPVSWQALQVGSFPADHWRGFGRNLGGPKGAGGSGDSGDPSWVIEPPGRPKVPYYLRLLRTPEFQGTL